MIAVRKPHSRGPRDAPIRACESTGRGDSLAQCRSAGARCAQAEMLLRAGKASAARDAMNALLKDPHLSRSSYRDLALYFHGLASFLVKDYVTAGRSLNRLTPFHDPAYGTHARYLLA